MIAIFTVAGVLVFVVTMLHMLGGSSGLFVIVDAVLMLIGVVCVATAAILVALRRLRAVPESASPAPDPRTGG
jgi:hypothetical protein